MKVKAIVLIIVVSLLVGLGVVLFDVTRPVGAQDCGAWCNWCEDNPDAIQCQPVPLPTATSVPCSAYVDPAETPDRCRPVQLPAPTATPLSYPDDVIAGRTWRLWLPMVMD